MTHAGPNQPTGGSETLRCASAVGPAGAPSDRTEGGPTGTTDIFSGRGATPLFNHPACRRL